MKKVLSFVLVLSMILGSFGMAFAAVPSDVAGKEYEDAVNVLIELGVVEGYKDGSYRPENVVTRAEMATLIIKALGLNDYAVGKSSFTDMNGHWADPYVAYATSLGFVSGFGDKTFRPNQTVTYDQAITMLVQALGYKGEFMVGGYPGAFVAQAKTLGMLEGIKSGAAGANRGDVATLLYNTLPAQFVRYDRDGVMQGVTIASIGSDEVKDTMLRRLGAKAYDEGKAFVVAGTEDAVINMKQYQGAYVTAYANDDDEIIAIDEVKSVFLKGDWNAKDEEFEADDVTYDIERDDYDNADKKATAAEEFVNGKLGTVTADDKEDETIVIAAKVSGKKIKEIYSVAVWKDGVTVQWDADLAEELADDDTLDGQDFAMNDDKEIDTDEFALLGVSSLKDIKEDAIVTYYVANKKVTKVEVSTEVVEGKVTRVNTDGDEVTIGGKKYDVALIEGDPIGAGDEGKFFLDYAGNIVKADTDTTEANDYAVVTGEMMVDKDKYDETTIVKLLTADGKEAIYNVEEDYAKEVTVGDFKEDAIVAYNLDKNGEVDKIEKVDPAKITGKLTTKGYLDGNKVVDNVVVFKVDSDGDYSVGKLADVKTNDTFKDSSYALNSDNEVVVIILGADDGADDDSVFGVVVAYYNAKNDDDDNVYEVEMLVDGKEETYFTTSRSVVIPSDEVLFEITFDGSDIKALDKATDNKDVTTKSGIVEKFSNGNIKLTGEAGYKEISADAAVYLINKDGDFELSRFSKISKGDYVDLYELDGTEDDENGFDVIIYKEK